VIAGIDLGGTQVRFSVARSDGRITGSERARTQALGGPHALAEWAAGAAERLGARRKLKSAAIGAPGPIDHHRGVLVNPPNLPGWRNVNLTELLSASLGCPVYLENDAQLAGLGEFHQGAGRGTRNMVYITWSTGVGGGLILGGELYSGTHGTAGEIGHMVMDPDGPLDGCGQRGCLEAFAGGNMLSKQTGRPAVELFREAALGDQEARMVVRRAARYMGYALINLTNLVDGDMIVIGGGIARGSWSLVQPTLLEVLRGSPFIKPARRPKVRRARLGDRAGQVGAVEWARAQL
jgi:glucokinase